jgi:ADP-ribose pyrophosphatase
MAPFHWKILKQKQIADCHIFKVETLTAQDPRTQLECKRSVIHFKEWCNVVAFTENDELILVHQFRFGTLSNILELPGGVIETGEDPLTAAKRELEEETGFRPKSVEFLGSPHPNPATQGNRIHIFLATRCERVHQGNPDEEEDIELVLIRRSDIPHAVASGTLAHALTLSALLLAKLKEPSIF